MKRILSLLFAAVVAVSPARAVLVLSDSFSYPDGAIVGADGSPWQFHSGTIMGTSLVTNGGQLELSFSGTRPEDVNALLTGYPFDTTNNPTVGILYSSFKVRMIVQPSGAGSYFAHFKDDTTFGFRCRVFALTNGASDGTKFRFGIGATNSASTSLGFALWPSDLTTGVTYKVVTCLNLTNGLSTLWVDPVAESDPSITNGPPNPDIILPVFAYAFRQASGIGVSRIDDLRVGTSFDDVAGTNNPPSITAIDDQNTSMGTPTPALPFTIGDIETPVGSLVLSSMSGNATLVPPANIMFGGSGANRTVTIEPAAGEQGTALITITVADADGAVASTTFTLSVGVPTVSAIANQITPIDIPRGPIPFTVGDTETPAGLLSVTATSSVPALVPDMNLVVGGSGADRDLTITPAAGMTGVATITVIVSDGINSVIERFLITVHPLLGLLRMDDFERADGPLVQFDGQWLSNGGSGGTNGQELQIEGGRAKVSENGSEDVSTEMPPGQFSTPIYLPASGTVLFAKLKFRLIDLPSPSGTYFAHFRDGGTDFRARVFVSTAGAAPGKFRLGIANNAATISTNAQVPGDLSTNVDYCVVVRYNVGTGESRLWLDPESESSPFVDAVDATFIDEIHAFSFRQNGGMGIVCVDDLKIGTLFTDVSPTRYRLTIERTPGSVRISWPAAATAAGLELQSATELPVVGDPAWDTYGNQGTPVADNLVVNIISVTGNEFFRLGPMMPVE